MKLTIIGTVGRIGPEQVFGPVRKRELLLLEGGDAGRPLPVEFTAGEHGPDRLLPLLSLEQGALVRVEAHLCAREWSGRHYLRLSGASVEEASFADPAATLPPPGAPPPPEDMRELPF